MLVLLLVSGSLSGRITDSETGDPVPFVGVKDITTGQGTISDGDGFFFMGKLSAGRHVFVFTQVGYEPETVSVILPEEGVKEIYPRLRPQAVLTKEIVTTGRRQEFERELAPVRIETEALRTMPVFLEPDVMRILQALPGVSAPNDFTTALYVRGSSPSENLILVDGAPVLNPFHMGGLFSTFSTEVLSGLEFWMGGFPARYGGRMSSVLDVQTKEGDTSGFHGSADVSMLASSAFLEGPLPFGSSFAFSARRTYFDKVLPLFIEDFEFPYYFYDLHGRVRVPINFRTWLGYTYFRSGDVLDFEFPEEYYSIDMVWGNVVNTMSLTYLHSPETFSKLGVYQSYFKMDMSEGTTLPSAPPYDWFKNSLTCKGGQYSLNWNKLDEAFSFGIEFQENDYYYYYTMGNYEFGVRGIPWRAGSFASYKNKHGRLLYNPSLRLDYYKGFSDFMRADPRLSLKYFLTDDLAWLLSGGVFHQYEIVLNQQEDILPFAYFWLPVLPGHIPQRSYHLITGLEQWISEGFTLKGEVYYKRIPISYDARYLYYTQEGNEIDEPEDFVLSPGYSLGADIILKKDIGSLVGWVGYSYCYAQRHQDGVGWYFPSYEKRHNANIYLSYNIGRWSFGTRFNLSSGTPYTARLGRFRRVYWTEDGDMEYWWFSVWGKKNSLRYPPYHRLDLFAEVSFHLWRLPLTITSTAINIYNNENVFFYYMDYSQEPPVRNVMNQLPRFFSVGIRSEF
ncbi:MAG: TonB-dependent receptor [candidate division WOR-3 bacterium]